MIKWLSIPEYTKQTGLSRGTILNMIENGDLIATTTDGGAQLRIKAESDPELDRLNERVKENNELLKQLCKHLGINQPNQRFSNYR